MLERGEFKEVIFFGSDVFIFDIKLLTLDFMTMVLPVNAVSPYFGLDY